MSNDKKRIRRAIVLAAAALLLCSGTAEAKKKSIRPDLIAGLQKEGKVASFDKLNQAALAKHPGGSITNTSLVARDERYDYTVHITDPKGDNWSLKLDAGSATVLTDNKVIPPVLPSLAVPTAPVTPPH